MSVSAAFDCQNFTVYQNEPCKYYERKAAKQKFFASFQSQTDLRLNFKEIFIMNNKKLVPEAKEAMDKFKMEAASEVGVNLKNGYNGDLTSRQAGSVGGQMVKKMIEKYENDLK